MADPTEEPQVQLILPPFCDRHQAEIVKDAKYKPTDPWRALLIVAQVAMFQGMTITPSVHKRLGGDITKITELGCFACRLPHKWAQVVDLSKLGLKEVKALGDGWVLAGLKKED